MVDYLADIGALRSKNIIEAFRKVDRADFVADPNALNIYEDHPLGIGFGQTISQPRTVAMMMEMLSPKVGEKILDIGSGSGWTTALLACIVGESGSVIGVERVEELVKFGSSNLKKYAFKNAKIIQAKDKLGVEGEKFDRILASAAADEFPYELSEQLNIGGKIVIPVQNSIYEMAKNENKELEGVEHYGFSFVPLIC
jgi:protein-L-isoaspartate(D-aspartate) O-methyltransferase